MFNGECKLATIWLYSQDTTRAGQFYRDQLQMKQIEHWDTNSFDGGGIRLSIHPMPSGMKRVPSGECFLVFYVRDGLEEKCKELKNRGVRLTEEIKEEPFGKTARLTDPDGHDIYLWEPPAKSSKNFRHVAGIVKHYETVLSKLEA